MIASIITGDGEILYSALNHVVEQEAVDSEDAGSPLAAPYLPLVAEPTPLPGLPWVGISADRKQWIERLGNTYIGFTNPLNHLTNIDPDAITVDQWFNNASIAQIETPWQDFSDGGRKKEFMELLITFAADSRLYLALSTEVQPRGIQQFKWFGPVYQPKQEVRISIKQAGTHIRFRLSMIMFNQARAMIRDMRVGFNPAGTS